MTSSTVSAPSWVDVLFYVSVLLGRMSSSNWGLSFLGAECPLLTGVMAPLLGSGTLLQGSGPIRECGTLSKWEDHPGVGEAHLSNGAGHHPGGPHVKTGEGPNWGAERDPLKRGRDTTEGTGRV